MSKRKNSSNEKDMQEEEPETSCLREAFVCSLERSEELHKNLKEPEIKMKEMKIKVEECKDTVYHRGEKRGIDVVPMFCYKRDEDWICPSPEDRETFNDYMGMCDLGHIDSTICYIPKSNFQRHHPTIDWKTGPLFLTDDNKYDDFV